MRITGNHIWQQIKDSVLYLVCFPALMFNVLAPTGNELRAQGNFYNPGTIQTIELFFTQPNWDYQMDTAILGTEDYIVASKIIINGVSFDSVGVRYKGNSSYDSTSKKNPLHIELNTYKKQTYQGIADIKLGNGYADPSIIREALSYEILANYMDCPRANFTRLFINGSYRGVFSNQESITRNFCEDLFGLSDQIFVKCNPTINPGPASKCNLKYISADTVDYFKYYDLKSDEGWKEIVKLTDTITNYPNSIENNIDTDRFLWMLAFNNVMVNLDSYTGAFCQNYYMYKDLNGRFSPIVWDLNMAFGGFPFAGSPSNGLGSLNVAGMQQLSATLHAGQADWPVLSYFLGNAVYKRKYIAHMRAIVTDYFSNQLYKTMAAAWQTRIDTAVQYDSNLFYSYSAFQNGLTANAANGSFTIPGISTLMDARVTYLMAQAEFTAVPPVATLVTSSTTTPVTGTPVGIKATITGASDVYLHTRFLHTGKFAATPMYDDGLHNDGAAGDLVYGASVNMLSEVMEYYVYAENTNAGVFSPTNAEHVFYTLEVVRNKPTKGEIVINEFVTSNDESDINDYGIYTDWIELYNRTNKQISLYGMYLSDDMGSKRKFAIPAGTYIEPYGFVAIWADGLPSKRYIHAPYKLASSGGELILVTQDNIVFDSISYGPQTEDISIGRCYDGIGSFTTINTPTFLGSNNAFCATAVNGENASEKQITLYPNPATQSFQLSAVPKGYEIMLLNVMGQKILNTVLASEGQQIDISAMRAGVYFVMVADAEGKKVYANKLVIEK